ncbi:MAG: 3-hydroxyanthranilate 3,4-dioxygenase [Planctomycetes bacterium]|nr:3-hydroxyanthranilate 3,4-dioxygenase [Planctomycetota bacterium]
MPTATTANVNPPFNLLQWIDENKEHLKPPVSNKQFFNQAQDVIVFVSGGPNTRNDYHVNATEELFYQIQGDICVGIRDADGSHPRDVIIREGEMFLLPRHLPHQPRRPADTVGLIIEFPRGQAEDALHWYCPNCDALVHAAKWKLKRIDKDLAVIMEEFWEGPIQRRTCKKCDTVIQRATAIDPIPAADT